MRDEHIGLVMRAVKRARRDLDTPYVSREGEARNPYRVLISCLLSLRTKDETTAEASERLFARADTPEGMLGLRRSTIERLIFPVGFYRVKAGQIREISRRILEDYDGRVPDRIETLLELPGVGRKTANLVVTMGYGKPGICVDVHVHRITNRWGYVSTKSPDQTEMALRDKLPRRHWIPINDLLVAFGRNVCHPVSPRCSTCPLTRYCARIGVTKHR